MKLKPIIITLLVAAVGAGYLMLANLGPLKDMNFGFGLTSGLAAQKIGGGYNMANVVLFIVFLVIIVVLGMMWNSQRKNR
jgi:hypothetical protein